MERNFNPDTEDEDENGHKKPTREKFLFRLTLKVRNKLFVSKFQNSDD